MSGMANTEDKVEKAIDKVEKAIEEYAGTFFWIILLVVLFITNPKSPSKHISVAKERVERIVQVTDAELNRAVVSSGGYLYRKSAEVRKELLSQIRNGDVLNLWFLSIGTYGPCISVGIFGMVFDISGLFYSEQDLRDSLWSGIDY